MLLGFLEAWISHSLCMLVGKSLLCMCICVALQQNREQVVPGLFWDMDNWRYVFSHLQVISDWFSNIPPPQKKRKGKTKTKNKKGKNLSIFCSLSYPKLKIFQNHTPREAACGLIHKWSCILFMFLCFPVCSAVSGCLTDSCALQVSILLLLLLCISKSRRLINLILVSNESWKCAPKILPKMPLNCSTPCFVVVHHICALLYPRLTSGSAKLVI